MQQFAWSQMLLFETRAVTELSQSESTAPSLLFYKTFFMKLIYDVQYLCVQIMGSDFDPSLLISCLFIRVCFSINGSRGQILLKFSKSSKLI